MLKIMLAALTSAWMLCTCQSALAETNDEASNSTAPAMVFVDGLAREDLLNVRATASPTGVVLGRLPNGSTLRSFGCSEVKGYKWCKVETIEGIEVSGWTPARYLQPAEPAGSIGSDVLLEATPKPESDVQSSEASAAAERLDSPAAEEVASDVVATEDAKAAAVSVPALIREAAERNLPQSAGADTQSPVDTAQPLLTAELSERLVGAETAVQMAIREPATITGEAVPAPVVAPAAVPAKAEPAVERATPPPATLAPTKEAVPLPDTRAATPVSPSLLTGRSRSMPSSEGVSLKSAAVKIQAAAVPMPVISPQASEPSSTKPEVSFRSISLPTVSPVLIALCAFFIAFPGFMAAILSFGPITFVSPFEPAATPA